MFHLTSRKLHILQCMLRSRRSHCLRNHYRSRSGCCQQQAQVRRFELSKWKSSKFTICHLLQKFNLLTSTTSNSVMGNVNRAIHKFDIFQWDGQEARASRDNSHSRSQAQSHENLYIWIKLISECINTKKILEFYQFGNHDEISRVGGGERTDVESSSSATFIPDF